MAHMNSPEGLVKQAKLMEGYGAKCIYIPDSAGHLLPEPGKSQEQLEHPLERLRTPDTDDLCRLGQGNVTDGRRRERKWDRLDRERAPQGLHHPLRREGARCDEPVGRTDRELLHLADPVVG